jgi:hypothetical protein
LFGGVLLWALVGWVMARVSSFELGAGTAMLLFGLTGMACAGSVGWFIFQHPGFEAMLEDPRQPLAMLSVFGAFGGFGLLGGGVLLASAARERRERWGRERELVAVSGSRERWGRTFTIAGNLAIMGCAISAAFMNLGAVQGIELVFGGVVGGCACFLLAFALKGRLTLEAALTLLLVGGGFGLALGAVNYLG